MNDRTKSVTIIYIFKYDVGKTEQIMNKWDRINYHSTDDYYHYV